MHNGDRPFPVGSHAIRDAFAPLSTPINIWTKTGNSSDADESAAGFPPSRAWDGWSHKLTKGDSSATAWYYVVDFNTDLQTFDTVYIKGDNLDQMAAGSIIALQIADNSLFTTNLITLVQWSVGGSYGVQVGEISNRMVHAAMGGVGPKVFSDVRFARIFFNPNGSFIPEISEFWLGLRRPIEFMGLPFDDEAERSVRAGEKSAGAWAGKTHYRGAAVRNPTIHIKSGSDALTFINWWRECGEGTRNFLYIEDPSTDAIGYVMTLDDPQLLIEIIRGKNLHTLSLSMSEGAPHVSGV